MSSLFKKLNTLVQATLNDALGSESSARHPVDTKKLGKNIDREIAALRQRIDEAIAHENDLAAQVESLRAEVDRLDRAADSAVQAGNNAEARHLITQMQRIQQRMVIADGDLREHQLVTGELIQRVNTLDAVVAEARRREAAVEEEKAAATPPDIPEQTERSPANALADMLRDAREKITRAGDAVQAETGKLESEAEQRQETASPADDRSVDDDLAARRQRLSKPK